MITVTILINGHPIYTRSAVNVTDKLSPVSVGDIYEVDTGELITHNRDSGAVELAKKLLDTIKEK